MMHIYLHFGEFKYEDFFEAKNVTKEDAYAWTIRWYIMSLWEALWPPG